MLILHSLRLTTLNALPRVGGGTWDGYRRDRPYLSLRRHCRLHQWVEAPQSARLDLAFTSCKSSMPGDWEVMHLRGMVGRNAIMAWKQVIELMRLVLRWNELTMTRDSAPDAC